MEVAIAVKMQTWNMGIGFWLSDGIKKSSETSYSLSERKEKRGGRERREREREIIERALDTNRGQNNRPSHRLIYD